MWTARARVASPNPRYGGIPARLREISRRQRRRAAVSSMIARGNRHMTADTHPRETLPDPGAETSHEGDRPLRRRDRRAHPARPDPLGHRLRRGVARAHRRPGRDRHVHPAQPGDQAEHLPRRLRPDRRRARRGPDLHLLGRREGLRAHQQLDGPAGDEGPDARAVRRLHAGPHDVRHPVRDGPPRGREPDVRHRAHRLGVRHRRPCG